MCHEEDHRFLETAVIVNSGVLRLIASLNAVILTY